MPNQLLVMGRYTKRAATFKWQMTTMFEDKFADSSRLISPWRFVFSNLKVNAEVASMKFTYSYHFVASLSLTAHECIINL